jgi:hypothetical protein
MTFLLARIITNSVVMNQNNQKSNGFDGQGILYQERDGLKAEEIFPNTTSGEGDAQWQSSWSSCS